MKRGSVFKVKNRPYWWIKYYRFKKPIYENSKSRKKSDAERLLRIRLGAVAENKHPGVDILKTTIHDLAELYIGQCKEKKLKSLKDAIGRAKLMDAAFGHLLATELTTTMLIAYRTRRRKERRGGTKGKDIADSTIDHELSILGTMYRCGLEHEPPLVTRVPRIKKVNPFNVRQGFFEHDEYQVLMSQKGPPEHVKVAICIGYYSGLRAGEIVRNLKWSQIDFVHDMIRLEPGTTKNKQGRVVPITPEMRAVLEAWRMTTLKRFPKCQAVIHWGGKPIKRITTAWNSARKRLGMPEKLFHDFRRTAVRNLDRAGVPRTVAMSISGHKTPSTYDRYNVRSHSDAVDAGKKLAAYHAAQLTNQLTSPQGGVETTGASDTQPIEIKA